MNQELLQQNQAHGCCNTFFIHHLPLFFSSHPVYRTLFKTKNWSAFLRGLFRGVNMEALSRIALTADLVQSFARNICQLPD